MQEEQSQEKQKCQVLLGTRKMQMVAMEEYLKVHQTYKH